MKRFILGTLTGVLVLALIVTFIPERAHSLIDQAGDVRGLLEDVAQRLERLERSPVDVEAVEVVLPMTASGPAVGSTIDRYAPAQEIQPVPVEEVNSITIDIQPPLQPMPEEVQRQAIDFDNLAACLSRVSGALERLNRTMKPGSRPARKSAEQAASDNASSS